MGLDLTGRHSSNPERHWRRYLTHRDEIAVVCLQDFDYWACDTSRFLDGKAYATEEAAREEPLDLVDMLSASRDANDNGVRLDVRRNISQILASPQNSGIEIRLGGFPLRSAGNMIDLSL